MIKTRRATARKTIKVTGHRSLNMGLLRKLQTWMCYLHMWLLNLAGRVTTGEIKVLHATRRHLSYII